jgi:hypothetical protein
MGKIKQAIENHKKKAARNQEIATRKQVIEELFYDFNSSRVEIYKMNFVRGIFFGFGSLVGGTIVIALLVGLLSLLTDIPGGVGDFVQYVVNIVRRSE